MSVTSFIKMIQHPVKFRMFLFSKLPSAFFSGLKLHDINEHHCTVVVPFKWFSQNPFKSTYFACLSMAAEMSTGVLAMMHTYQSNPAVSMLVIKMEAHFYKKAIGKTFFTCEEGDLIANTIQEAKKTGEGQTLRVTSVGLNESGEQVAQFYITWSFKPK